MGFYKNGIVKDGSFYESDAMMMNKITSISYTPVKDTNNSCLSGEAITGFMNGKQYYAELTLNWSGFKDDVGSNFSCRVQGSTYNGTSWDWNRSNPLADVFGSLTSILLSVKSGTKKMSGIFTANDRTGYYLGIRTNYSNGTGTMGFSDIKAIPVEYLVVTPPPRKFLISQHWKRIYFDRRNYGILNHRKVVI